MRDKKRIIIYLLVVIIAAAAVYFFSETDDITDDGTNESPQEKIIEIKNQELLAGLDPQSYDEDLTFLDFQGNEMTVAPYNYDGDEYENFKDKIRTLQVTEDVKVFDETRNSVIKSGGKKETKIEYSVSSLEKIKETLDSGMFMSVYVWLDGQGKVTAVMSHGETTIWE